jgi:hypothetical protein
MYVDQFNEVFMYVDQFNEVFIYVDQFNEVFINGYINMHLQEGAFTKMTKFKSTPSGFKKLLSQLIF